MRHFGRRWVFPAAVFRACLCHHLPTVRSCLAPLIAAVAITAGCNEDVTGHWCGRRVATDAECVGDEAGLLLLNQAGNEVDGQACEAHNHDCHVIEKGVIDGRNVAFYYSFADGNVDAKLTVKGDVLTGTYFASKCKCTLSQTFYRIR